MRYLIALFLSLSLCLNASHALASGVYEAIEHGGDPQANVLVVEHVHLHDHDDDENPLDVDDLAQTHADHSHAHPPLYSLIPDVTFALGIAPRSPHPRDVRDTFVSFPSQRLERPPRTSRA